MKNNRYIDLIIIGFIFLILFMMPALFVRVDGAVSWKHVFKIWQDNAPLLPVFVVNHWVLLPELMHKKKYSLYVVAIVGIIILATCFCDMIDSPRPMRFILPNGEARPEPVPPYANMLMYAILITGVDIGLFFSKMWQNNERQKLEIEKKNTSMELELLRSQISPHFFMNTLNNIYALAENDGAKAKAAVMKLSKMMRYMLYENKGERVRLSKEFEFIRNYIDLMRLRFTDNVEFILDIPEIYHDVDIPPMLFISYIENAVKHGVSYQEKCEINIHFALTDEDLSFSCLNAVHRNPNPLNKGGIGLKNSKARLSLIYGDRYDLDVIDKDGMFSVFLKIPII
jgi:hypothetical protein